MGRTSEKSLLTLSSLGSSISHYCPLIDFLSLIYGRKKMSQWNGLLIKLLERFWAINPDLYIQVSGYFHILVSSIRVAECDSKSITLQYSGQFGKTVTFILAEKTRSLLYASLSVA